jgi:predicted HTH transcriptional regulator
MNSKELFAIIARDEDSKHQFKSNVISDISLAAEMVAFSNTQGGMLMIGVADDGSIAGLNRGDMGRLSNLISNVASQHVKPPINPVTENIALDDGLVLGFVLRHIKRVQGAQGVNSLGELEIPKVVFEELIANALIHRDYFVSAPVRLFVFSDRVDIISPGHLPNNLTIENIKNGNSNIRNPILASFATKLLPYRGLGSGIRRAIKAYPDIEFEEDREGNLFKATIRLPASNAGGQISGVESGVESGVALQILELLSMQVLSKAEIAKALGKAKPTRYLNDLMKKMIQRQQVEYTIPDKPNSRLQKYRLVNT